ncbi:MAG TPA: heavy metal translocating P-type ATPase [Rhodocyclaceae bacterium]|nr:heavy metal translocating P-type ATPase [Rhodocyclaceae bacterium]
MSESVWISRLEIAHALRGRVRFRYRCRPGSPGEALVVERAVENLPGVIAARVNIKAHALVVHFDPELTAAAELQRAIGGLSPSALATGTPGDLPALSPNAVLLSLANLLTGKLQPPGLQQPLALAAAAPLLRHAAADLASEGINSHVLEALAVLISTARRDYTAANTTTFMLALGEYLEDSIARRSDDLLKHLLRPCSDQIWVDRDGTEIQIAGAEVMIGDRVIVGTGTVIPVDGTVLGGLATVNEAAMTGESAAVTKERGASVLSGTLVEDGRLVIYAEQVGSRTAAARIADYVAQSLVTKSQAQLNASRLADRLVPSILGLAGAAWLVSGDPTRAASVLQADYSCALKLATPVAFKSAMYAAGKSGILVKGGSALEKLAEADTFIFDKTGTLTEGTLEVTDALAFDGAYTPEDLICLAASVEEHYHHPLALAVVAAAQATPNRHHFDHQEVQFIVAHGVASVIAGQRIVVGSRHFVEDDERIDVSRYLATIERLRRAGKTLLYIGYGGKLLGILALKDEIRAASAATLQRLRTLGVRKILLLTGDHRQRAEELASQLGIDECHAELLPEDKSRIVEQLATSGHRIAFVGDGINDAPALAGAHVGIAMQRGADIARLTADIALLEDKIERVADAKALANAAMKRIDHNYRLTVGLNTGILAAAALGLLSPVTTSLLHNGSTIGILLNALRRP